MGTDSTAQESQCSLDEMTRYKLNPVIPVKNLTYKVDWIGKKLG